MANRDEMSFRNAFADARRELGAGRTFTWRGNRYTTDYEDEVSSSSSRAPSRSPTPTARPSRYRSVEQVREDSERAISRAENRDRGPSLTERFNQSRARSQAAAIEDALPAPVERLITRSARTESEETRARRAALQSFRDGESTDFITRMLRDLFAGFRERQDRARSSARRQAGENAARNERLNELRGMNKGGTVRTGKMDRRKSGMFYDSKSPRGYK